MPLVVALALALAWAPAAAAGETQTTTAPQAPVIQKNNIRYQMVARAARLNRRVTGDVTDSVRGVPASPVDSLVYDGVGSTPIDGAIVILEVDPVSKKLAWSYVGNDQHPFLSKSLGAAARLPNGNTLITVSNYGRAFEVDPAGNLVWEFFNPHRTGPEGRFVAVLPEMIRLPIDFPIDWSQGRSSAPKPKDDGNKMQMP